jgi:hypothetical protein
MLGHVISPFFPVGLQREWPLMMALPTVDSDRSGGATQAAEWRYRPD